MDSFLKEKENPVVKKLIRRIEKKKLLLELARQDYIEKLKGE